MKTVVTGATGFLGRAVVEVLVGEGHEVRALVRNPAARLPNRVDTVAARLDDVDALVAAIDGADAVIHVAGFVSRDRKDAAAMYAVHVEGTRTLLCAMERARVRKLVLASTSGTIAVDKTGGRTKTEADNASLEIIGRWPYYSSKRIQEEEVLRWNAEDRIEAIVLNPSLLLGPGDERMSSTEDVHRILVGRVLATTPGTMAIVDVRDAAPMFLAALLRGRRGERYLLNGANIGVRTFVERVCHAGNVPIPKLRMKDRWAIAGAKAIEVVCEVASRPAPVDSVSVEMSCCHWGCSAEKVQRELGFVARDPQSTIVDTVDDLIRRGAIVRNRRAAIAT